MRKEVIGNATLYCADCLDVAGSIDEIDAVITDPPYMLKSIQNINKYPTRKKAAMKSFSFGEQSDSSYNKEDIINRILAFVSKARHNAFIFTSHSNIGIISDFLSESKMTPKTWFWIKNNPLPAAKGTKFSSAVESAVFGYRRNAYFGDNNKSRKNYMIHATASSCGEKSGHPTQKPLKLMQYIIETFVPAGGICVDPFMGSGTTGVAAVLSGRKFIGIEIVPEYFDIACKRIEEAQKQGKLF